MNQQEQKDEKYQKLLNEYNRIHDLYTELYNTGTIADIERENQILRNVGDVELVGYLKEQFCKKVYILNGKISRRPTNQWIYVLPDVKLKELPPVDDLYKWADETMLEQLKLKSFTTKN